MNRKLGAFTCYGIEDVFHYLGEMRIQQRIKELEGKPTMGRTLKSFTYDEPENSYLSIAGVFSIFGELIVWFNDYDLIMFLYEKSKSYNELNYFDGGILPSKWDEEIILADFMINRSPDQKQYYETRKANPYWNEYHFFYMHVFKRLKKLVNKDLPVDALLEEMIGNYITNFDSITTRVRIENSSYEKKILANGFLFDAFDYYEKNGSYSKAESIALLNNKYLDVWSEIQIDYEEE